MNPPIPLRPCWICGKVTDRYQFVRGNACSKQHMEDDMAFNQEIADKVCERLAAGESLRKACEATEGAVRPTILLWVNENAAFADQYARARQIGYTLIADQIIDIADTTEIGVKTKTNEKGEVETTEGDMIEHRRLRVDTRKWMLSKMLPKVYGDKLETTHKGTIGVTVAANPTDEAL